MKMRKNLANETMTKREYLLKEKELDYRWLFLKGKISLEEALNQEEEWVAPAIRKAYLNANDLLSL